LARFDPSREAVILNSSKSYIALCRVTFQPPIRDRLPCGAAMRLWMHALTMIGLGRAD